MRGTDLRMSLLFRVGGLLGALPLASAIEILRPLPIEPVPDAPPFVAGLSIVRGEPIPILALYQRSGASSEGSGRCIVLRVGTRRVALLVDELIGIHALDAQRLVAMPPLLRQANAPIETIGALDGELLAVLDTARLVPEPVASLAETLRIAS